MTIKVRDTDLDTTFTARDVLDMEPRVMRALAKELLLRQAEATLTVVIDDPGVCPVLTRDSINDELRNVEGCARDSMQDFLEDICLKVKQVMHGVAFGAAVTCIRFDLAGDPTEIELDVAFTDRVNQLENAG
jgi:hypothetical protein